MTRTVIITGTAGFLGRYTAREFAREGWRVIGLDDVAPENVSLGTGTTFERMKLPHSRFSELLREAQPDACVHCAGRASVPLSMEDPASDFRDNTVLTFELLEALRIHAPRCRFLLLSSAAVYGNPAHLPVAEADAIAPLSPYGFHKRQCELLCDEFARIFNLPTIAVRIFSAYGPGLRRQVMWDICERALTQDVLQLRGTGAESRDFIHARDIARALTLLAHTGPASGDIYNLASGSEITVAALAQQLVTALGSPARVVFDGTVRSGDPRNWRADVSRLAALGFTPSVPLDRGLQDVAVWAAKELVT